MSRYYPATPFPPQFVNPDTGELLSGGTLEAYIAGTSTPTMMYADEDGTEAGTSITLNAGGYPEVTGTTIVIFLDRAVRYKFILKDASAASKWTIDGISALQDVIQTNSDTHEAKVGLSQIGTLDLSAYEYAWFPYRDEEGDGGGGRFYKIATGTADDGIIFTDSASNIWKRFIEGYISPKWFGARSSRIDNQTPLNAAFTAAKALGIPLHGESTTYTVTADVVPLEGVDVEQLWVKADSTFVATTAVIASSSGSSGIGNLNDIIVHCNNTTAKGIVIDRTQNAHCSKWRVFNHRDDAITVSGGYEMFLTDYETVGSDLLAGFAPVSNSVCGLRVSTSDGHYINGASVRTPRGLIATGGNNQFIGIHNWSVYTSGQQQMFFCFFVTGENNTFTNCVSDSPNSAVAGSPSTTNGGYGFYVDNAGNGLSTRLIGCSVIIPTGGVTPTNSVIPVHVGKTGCEVDVIYQDRTTVSINKTIEYFSLTVEQGSRITGGNVSTARGAITDVTIVNPTVAAGGDGTGYTYFTDRDTIRTRWHGGMIHLSGYVRLTAKGGGVGTVTMEGLPASRSIGNAFQWIGTARVSNTETSTVFCFMAQNSTSLQFRKADGTLLADTDLGNSSEFYFSISYEPQTLTIA